MTEQTLPSFTPDTGFLPLLPLRDVVVYPHLVIPLFVGRAKSVKALEIASEGNKQIFLLAQKSANKDEPEASDLYDVGTIATVLQMLKLPDGTVKVLVEGVSRAKLVEFQDTEECFTAKAEVIVDVQEDEHEVQALMRTVFTQFDQYVKLFNLSWVEPWLVEAVAMIIGALILAIVICKAMDGLNGDR